MVRLLIVLAWADCQEAAWLLAARDRGLAARRVVMAVRKLEEAARIARKRRRPVWRPVLRAKAPRAYGAVAR
jgi:hypothetical protein